MEHPATNDDLDLLTYRDDLMKVGIDGECLAKKHKAELEAMQSYFVQWGGKVTDTKKVIAWGIRQRARMDANKLRGDYPTEKMEHSGNIIFQTNVPEPDPLPEDEDA